MQTTRVFAPWKDSSQRSDTWHEIARPQVHGHDINCVSIIRGNGNHRFVSGADEKVSRVFEAPLSFLKTLNQLTSQACAFPENDQPETQILGANMSALGLSQKPIYVQGNACSLSHLGSYCPSVNMSLTHHVLQLLMRPRTKLVAMASTPLNLFLMLFPWF